MPLKKTQSGEDRPSMIVAEARRDRERRERGYRAKALKMFPHVCARCGREFSGKRLRELTVHHKDGNHDNNPPDGSNWELLCIYCHDDEHSRSLDAEWYEKPTPGDNEKTVSTYKPFAGLDSLFKGKK